MTMKAHVTCGRGTEVFVRAELLDKLPCTVCSVEDGKLFFTLADIPDWPGPDSHHKRVFSLKTVERIFATVTHFPTSDIKGNGKVKFLHALKDRILNGRNLKEAVESTHKLRHARKVHTDQSTQSCSQNSAEPPNAGAPHKSPVQTEHDSDVDKLSSTSRTETCGNHQSSGPYQHPVNCSDQAMNSVAKNGHCGEHFRNPHRQVSVKGPPTEHRLSLPVNSCNSFIEDCHTQQNHTTNNRACKRTKGQNADLASVCMTEPPVKLQRCDSVHTSVDDEDRCEEQTCVRSVAEKQSSVADEQTGETAVSFRFSVKCGGWCKKWLQPQRLAKELGVRLTIMTGWTSHLSSPDIEICVHINDDFVTAGIPLTRIPLSKRDYIQDAGLRSTISWIMAQQADIQPGHCVLDPMCGKATILVEAAKEHPQLTGFLGCDIDPNQLQAADRNMKQAHLCQSVQLVQADVLNQPLRSGCVDRIVCDAPFGNKFTVASCTLPEFYRLMMQEMHRLLAPGGLAVLLTSQELVPVVQENCRNASCPALVLPTVDKTSTPCKSSDGLDGLQKSAKGEVTSAPTVQASTASVTQGVQGTEKLQQINACASSCLQTGGEMSLTNFTQQSGMLRTRDGHPSHQDDCTVKCLSDQEATTAQNSDRTDEFGEETTSACGTENGCFSLLSNHYVKLGETHAYIVVLQK